MNYFYKLLTFLLPFQTINSKTKLKIYTVQEEKKEEREVFLSIYEQNNM